jgi:hypothetical protein
MVLSFLQQFYLKDGRSRSAKPIVKNQRLVQKLTTVDTSRLKKSKRTPSLQSHQLTFHRVLFVE